MISKSESAEFTSGQGKVQTLIVQAGPGHEVDLCLAVSVLLRKNIGEEAIRNF